MMRLKAVNLIALCEWHMNVVYLSVHYFYHDKIYAQENNWEIKDKGMNSYDSEKGMPSSN